MVRRRLMLTVPRGSFCMNSNPRARSRQRRATDWPYLCSYYLVQSPRVHVLWYIEVQAVRPKPETLRRRLHLDDADPNIPVSVLRLLPMMRACSVQCLGRSLVQLSHSASR